MTHEIICENCQRQIPDSMKHVERSDGKIFCCDECDGEYDKQAEQNKWLDELEIGDDVVVEQPAYRFRYYPTTVSDVDKDGIMAKGFPSVLFIDGECRIGGFGYLLLEPTDELLDKINLITTRKLLEHTDWSKVEDDVVMDVWDLVYNLSDNVKEMNK